MINLCIETDEAVIWLENVDRFELIKTDRIMTVGVDSNPTNNQTFAGVKRFTVYSNWGTVSKYDVRKSD